MSWRNEPAAHLTKWSHCYIFLIELRSALVVRSLGTSTCSFTQQTMVAMINTSQTRKSQKASMSPSHNTLTHPTSNLTAPRSSLSTHHKSPPSPTQKPFPSPPSTHPTAPSPAQHHTRPGNRHLVRLSQLGRRTRTPIRMRNQRTCL